LGKRLHEHFDLIYGTSTGSIIGALIALGESIDTISQRYFELIPKVMHHNNRKGRSAALRNVAGTIFGSKKFDEFKVNVGIVAMHYGYEKPMIFKSDLQQAHGRKNSFIPGFGCTISDAVVASCSAYPYFEKTSIVTSNQDHPELVDGGFVANNPTLFALADATKSLKIEHRNIRVLSVGVGNYSERKISKLFSCFSGIGLFELMVKVFNSSSNTIDQLRSVLFPEISIVRVNGAYTQKTYETNFLEKDVKKLEKLKGLGRESFAANEQQIRDLLTK
jgi:patatin-like phospholipase/acyl hydrolase